MAYDLLHEPIIATEPVVGRWKIAEDFNRKGQLGAVVFKDVEIKGESDIELIGGDSWETRAEGFGVWAENSTFRIRGLKIRGFQRDGLEMRGCLDCIIENFSIADCRAGIRLNGKPAGDRWNENISLIDGYIGDTWEDPEKLNLDPYRPGFWRGTDALYVISSRGVLVQRVCTRGTGFAGFKISRSFDVHLEEILTSSIGFQGLQSWKEGNPEDSISQEPSTGLVLRNSVLQSGMYGCPPRSPTKCISVGTYADARIENVSMSAAKEPRRTQYGMQINTGGKAHLRDVSITGQPHFGIDYVATHDAKLTTEGRLHIDADEPIRIR